MPNDDYETILSSIDANKDLLALKLGQVESIDNYLEAKWGISLPPSPDLWEEQLHANVPSSLLQRYQYLHDKQASYLERDKPIPPKLETRFYNTISAQPLLGLIHSQKRTLILDSLALVASLVRHMRGMPRILDIGCHVGYQSLWLASNLGTEVVGIDISSEATRIATQAAGDNLPVRFVTGDICKSSELGQFDLVMAIDCYPWKDEQIAKFLKAFSDRVAEGGILLLVGGILKNHRTMPKLIEGVGLGYGFADVTGGWMGEGRGFEASLALALVKGGSRKVPPDFASIAQEPWDMFAAYANAPNTTPSRKTISYFRASERDLHLSE